MKRFFLATVSLLLLAVCAQAVKINGFNINRKKLPRDMSVGIIFAYSGIDSQNEDENIKVKIYNDSVWVHNKTDKTIYISAPESHISINNGIMDLNGGRNVSNQDIFMVVSPHSRLAVGGMMANPNYFRGHYSVEQEPGSKVLNDENVQLMELVDELKGILESGDIKGASKHFTQEEALFKIDASITYSLSKKADAETYTVSSSNWISDIMLSPYYVVVPTLAKAEKGSFKAKKAPNLSVTILHPSPFEFEAEQSPISIFDITINSGKGYFDIQDIFTYNEEGKRCYKSGSEYKELEDEAKYNTKYYRTLFTN